MRSPLLAVVDCGTSSVKAALADCGGRLRGIAERACPVTRRSGGAVEIDPGKLKLAVFSALREAVLLAGRCPREVVALSVTGQRATVFGLDDRGAPLAPGLNWQDMRGVEATRHFEAQVGSRRFTALTGLPCNAVFTVGKLLDLRARRPGIFRATRRFALINDYVLGLLGADNPPADWSSASLTGLLDTGKRRWSDELLDAAEVPLAALPALAPPGTIVGSLSRAAGRAVGLPAGIPLVTGAGDQQCAGLGAGVIVPGIVEITMGTVAVPLAFSGRFRPDGKRRVMCCAHGVPEAWNLEGLQNSAGSSVDWLIRLMGIPSGRRAALWKRVAAIGPGSAGLRFLPYLAGSAAPHWDAQATGAFLGLTLGHEREALLRAVLEGIGFEAREIVETFEGLGVPVREVRLTGGYAGLPAWNRMLAGILGRPVYLMAESHATLLGAAMLAASGAGLFVSVPAASRAMARVRQAVEPDAKLVDSYRNIYFDYRNKGGAVRRAGFYRNPSMKEAGK